MDQDHQQFPGGEPNPGRQAHAPNEVALGILQRYSAGDMSARQAAKELGTAAKQHDVFAGIRAARLPLPVPSPEELAREIAALHALYGPNGPLPPGPMQRVPE